MKRKLKQNVFLGVVFLLSTVSVTDVYANKVKHQAGFIFEPHPSELVMRAGGNAGTDLAFSRNGKTIGRQVKVGETYLDDDVMDLIVLKKKVEKKAQQVSYPLKEKVAYRQENEQPSEVLPEQKQEQEQTSASSSGESLKVATSVSVSGKDASLKQVEGEETKIPNLKSDSMDVSSFGMKINTEDLKVSGTLNAQLDVLPQGKIQASTENLAYQKLASDSQNLGYDRMRVAQEDMPISKMGSESEELSLGKMKVSKHDMDYGKMKVASDSFSLEVAKSIDEVEEKISPLNLEQKVAVEDISDNLNLPNKEVALMDEDEYGYDKVAVLKVDEKDIAEPLKIALVEKEMIEAVPAIKSTVSSLGSITAPKKPSSIKDKEIASVTEKENVLIGEEKIKLAQVEYAEVPLSQKGMKRQVETHVVSEDTAGLRAEQTEYPEVLQGKTDVIKEEKVLPQKEKSSNDSFSQRDVKRFVENEVVESSAGQEEQTGEIGEVSEALDTGKVVISQGKKVAVLSSQRQFKTASVSEDAVLNAQQVKADVSKGKISSERIQPQVKETEESVQKNVEKIQGSETENVDMKNKYDNLQQELKEDQDNIEEFENSQYIDVFSSESPNIVSRKKESVVTVTPVQAGKNKGAVITKTLQKETVISYPKEDSDKSKITSDVNKPKVDNSSLMKMILEEDLGKEENISEEAIKEAYHKEVIAQEDKSTELGKNIQENEELETAQAYKGPQSVEGIIIVEKTGQKKLEKRAVSSLPQGTVQSKEQEVKPSSVLLEEVLEVEPQKVDAEEQNLAEAITEISSEDTPDILMRDKMRTEKKLEVVSDEAISQPISLVKVEEGTISSGVKEEMSIEKVETESTLISEGETEKNVEEKIPTQDNLETETTAVETVDSSEDVESLDEKVSVETTKISKQGSVTTLITKNVEVMPVSSKKVDDVYLSEPVSPGMEQLKLGESIQDWKASQGDTLRNLLTTWAEKAGWTVVWMLDRDYHLQAGVVFRGRFVDVAGAIVRVFARATPAPIGTFYKGNRVLVINAQEEENGY